jgi:hypothetical protein
MPRRARSRRKQWARKNQRQKEQSQDKKKRMLTVLWGLVVALSVIGGLSGYFYVLPSVDVQPVMELPTGHVFPNTFSLKNDGYLTIYPVQVRFVIRNAITTNQVGFRNVGTTQSLDKISLQRGESADIAMPQMLGIGIASIVSADILLIVRFRQWGWRWPFTKRVKIAIWKEATGNTRFAKPPLTAEDRGEQ